jgi:hypothetical protein
MFFSKALLVATFLGAISALATPHPLHHHPLHRRALAARLASVRDASAPNNNITVSRQNSPKCNFHPSSNLPVSPQTPQTASHSTPVIPQPSLPPSTPSPSPTPSSSTTPQQQPPATTSSAPPAQSSDGPFTGEGTFFDTGLGACGITNVDTDFICAISKLRFDTFPGYDGVNPNTNPVCNQKIQLSYQGNSVTLTIVDRCTGCGKNDVDMTPTAFSHLAPLTVGRLKDVTWSFI